MKARYLILSLLAATALPMPSADAAVLLIFGQTSTGDTVTATRTLSSTTITSSTPVDITEIDAQAFCHDPDPSELHSQWHQQWTSHFVGW